MLFILHLKFIKRLSNGLLLLLLFEGIIFYNLPSLNPAQEQSCTFARDKLYSSIMVSPKFRKQVTIRFLHRTVLFLFTVLIALFALFILGNVQNFLDSSQIIILRFLIGSGILLFLCAVFAFLFEIRSIIRSRKFYYLGHCIISVVACIFGLIIAIAAAVIMLLSNGLNPV